MITDELKNKVKQTFKNKKLNGNTIHQILKKDIELKTLLQQQFQTKPKIYNSIGKLILLIVNDVQLKHCKTCGEEMSYDRTMSQKSLFCSNKCKMIENPFSKEEVKKKIRQTNLKKYGVENPAQNKEIREKRNKTCMERYGCINPLINKYSKQKIKQSKIEKYGVESFYNDPLLRQKMLRGKYDTTYQKLKERLKEQNLQPYFKKEQFIGTNHKYKWKCLKCSNIFESTYHNGIVYSRCFICNPRVITTTSSYQIQICTLLKQWGLNFIQHDRKIIFPKELDIIIPEKKIAIQFNGTYWHSSQIKTKNYHIQKTELCQKKGYRLIHIFEYDWTDLRKKQIIIQKLKAILNVNQTNIYARKCIIKQIVSKQKNEFLNAYHIQGQDKSNIKLGLYYQDQLVAVMTFNKPRFNKKYQWELVRYATKSGYRVLGGAGKLLNYFQKHYNPKSIISYADRKYSVGNLYYKLGFKLLFRSDPNYIWVNKNNVEYILTRYQCQKHKLKQLLGQQNFDQNLSQKENMQKNGFYQIFDCGNYVFVKDFKNEM